MLIQIGGDQAKFLSFGRLIDKTGYRPVGVVVDVAVLATSILPAVIDVDKLIPQIGQSQFFQHPCLRQDGLLGDVGAVGIPRCPTHNR